MTSTTKTLSMTQVLVCGAAIVTLSMGIRHGFGLWLQPITQAQGWTRETFAFAIAIQNIAWGTAGIFAGMVADRFGAFRVIIAGALFYAAGLFGMAHAATPLTFALSTGVLIGIAQAGTTYAVVYGVIGRNVSAERRSWAMGITAAAGSFGQFLMAPIAAGLTAMTGWMTSMQILGFIVLLALPAAWVLKGNSNAVAQPASTASAPPAAREGTGAAIKRALSDPSYLMLGAGFFVCGFHVAFLGTHLPNVVAMCGLPPSISAWSLAVLGLFNIVGSLLMGWAVGRWRMKSLLSLVYATRAVAVAVFLMAPKTGLVMLIFAAVMGLTFLSTVPPTAGLVARFFGPANMATLFGLVLLTHQVGGFMGAWKGGKVFEATGSYDWLWYADIVLAVGAALIHLPIKEAPQARAVAA